MNVPNGEETIFAEALRLPADERAAYLDHACGDDLALRRRIEALLGAGERVDDGFLEVSAASALRQTISLSVPLTEKPGDRIGRYKLLQQIGEGGCGVVYMAEQEEPVRRRVALKIIKLGMDTKSVIARFEAERQALAMMDHPNIAKVFDAGATEGRLSSRPESGDKNVAAPIPAGRPYFVMELVRGMKITDYCDEAKLSTRARLDLFMQVCQAIQHAHQKGIIHRDIKPSNILVTVNDGVPVPKVIDFGIAKATSGQQLTDKTLFTAFEQFIGTPAYMSPEQAVLTSLDIDTRSDIYALGVLLYELLTGKTPFDGKELLAIGLDEMRRTIREQEPQRPSTRLSTLAQNELSTTAQRRGLDAPKLVSELRGDLDWIVMKCLEKDRARRYETANGLAMDIQRHLNNEPVVACPPSRVYRLQKTVRRNRLAFGAAASVVAALAIGLGISTWRFVKEREALKRALAAEEAAKEEKDSAEAVLKFVREKILAADRPEGEGGGVGKGVTLRQAIDRAESNISKAFTNRPLVEAAIRKTLGESYLYYLGEPILAIPQLERAVALRRQGLGLENEHTLTTMSSLARAYDAAGKYEQAISLHLETLEWQKTRMPNHRNTLLSMADLAAAYRSADKLDQALPLAEEALKLSKAVLKPDDKITLHSMTVLANCYLESGKLDQATSLYQKTLELQQARLQPDDPATLGSMHNLAVAYGRAGKNDQALALNQQTLKLRTARLGPDHPDTLSSMLHLALSYYVAGKFDLGLPLNEQALKLQEGRLGPDHPDTLRSMKSLADGYHANGKLDLALPLYQKTLKLLEGRLGPDHSDTLLTMSDLADAYQHAGKLELALPLYDALVKLQEAKRGSDHRDTLDTMHKLAVACISAGEFERGVALLTEILKLRQAHHGPDHPNTMNDLARAYESAGKFDPAIQVREEIFKLHNTRRGPNHPDTLRAEFRLGQTLVEAAELHTGDSGRRQDLANRGERLLRNYLVGVRGYYTNNPVKLADRLNEVAEFRYRQPNYAESEPLYREIVQLRRTASGAEHKDTLDATASLARLLSDWAWAEREQAGRAVPSAPREVAHSGGAVRAPLPAKAPVEMALEAERLLRDVLAARLRESTNSWRIGDVKSRLGGALVCVAVTDSTRDAEVREAKFNDAESLLLEGYDRLQVRSANPKYVRDARERINRLYEAWNKPARRAEWQQKQVASLRAAAEKGNVGALNDLAWFLATCSDAAIRHGSNAVMFAQKAVSATNRKNPVILDTLAAAYAEVGDFGKAVGVQTEAIALLHDEKEKKGYKSRLKLYQSNTPYREPWQ